MHAFLPSDALRHSRAMWYNMVRMAHLQPYDISLRSCAGASSAVIASCAAISLVVMAFHYAYGEWEPIIPEPEPE